MNDEERAAYKLIFSYGAKKTGALIRCGKMPSYGPAIMSACRELGTSQVVEVLEELGNPEYSACAIRYAPGITPEERVRLAKTLSVAEIAHAKWALDCRFLSDDERSVLQWMSELKPAK